MGLRMRKSFKLAKGVRLNVGRKSASISVGNKYGHTTISTGSSRKSTGHLKEDLVEMVRNQNNVTEKQKNANLIFMKVCSVLMTIIGTISLMIGIVAFYTAGLAGIFFVAITLFCYFFAWAFKPVKQSQKSHKSHRK